METVPRLATALVNNLGSNHLLRTLPLVAGLVGLALLALRIPGAIARGNLRHTRYAIVVGVDVCSIIIIHGHHIMIITNQVGDPIIVMITLWGASMTRGRG